MRIAIFVGVAMLGFDFCAPEPARAQAKKFIESPAVQCFAMSPDGKTIALVERDHSVRVRQVGDARDVRVFSIGGSRESYVSMAAFAPDGKSLAVAGSGRLEIWDVETGKLRQAFKNEVKVKVNRLVRGDDGAIRQVTEVVARPDDVRAARFSGDGKTLYSSGKENHIKIWDAASGKEKSQLTGHAHEATHLAVSANGKVLASGTFERAIKVWDLETHKEIASLDNPASVYGLALSSDGKRLLSSSGVEVILWDVGEKKALGNFKGARGAVSRVAFSPDDRLVVAQAVPFMVWDAETFEQRATFEPSPVFGFAITPDGKSMLSCDAKGVIRVNELPKAPAP